MFSIRRPFRWADRVWWEARAITTSFLNMVGGYGMLDGKRVMSEAAVKMGTSNLLPPGDSVTKGTSIEGYGFGAGGRMGGTGGRNNYGWAGAAGTIGFVEMGTRVSAAGSTPSSCRVRPIR